MEEKRPVGRPSEYSEEIQQKAEWYVHGGYKECEDVIPSRAGLSILLKATRQTLINWGNAYPIFLDTLKELDAMQEKIALSNGIAGVFNPTITKLVLANHGYSEKQELDHKSSDGSMTPAPVGLPALYAALDDGSEE